MVEMCWQCSVLPVVTVGTDGSAGAGDCESRLVVEVRFRLGCGTTRRTLQGRSEYVLLVGWKSCGGGRVSSFNVEGKCPK